MSDTASAVPPELCQAQTHDGTRARLPRFGRQLLRSEGLVVRERVRGKVEHDGNSSLRWGAAELSRSQYRPELTGGSWLEITIWESFSCRPREFRGSPREGGANGK